MNDESKGVGRMFVWSDRVNNPMFAGENEETTQEPWSIHVTAVHTNPKLYFLIGFLGTLRLPSLLISRQNIKAAAVGQGFFFPGATTPVGGCILQPSSGL